MGEDTRINYAQMIGKEIPSDIIRKHDYFNIEISIVMRKPTGHYSRAPGLIWKILNLFNGYLFPRTRLLQLVNRYLLMISIWC